MKKIIPLLLLILTFTSPLYAQKVKEISELSKIKGVTVVQINKQLLNLIPKIDQVNGIDTNQLSGKLESILILNGEDKAATQLGKEMQLILKSLKVEPLLYASDEGEETTMYYVEGSKKENQFILFSQEPDEVGIIVLKGSFTPQDISTLVNK